MIPGRDQPASRGRVTVNLQTVADNYRIMARHSAPGRCAAVVKANAYGLGAQPVSGRLWQAGCRAFFVASVDEGVALRGWLPEAEIYVFDGFDPAALAAYVEQRLVPVLNTAAQHHQWLRCASSGARPATDDPLVWHVDTGMSRLGMSESVALSLAATTADTPTLLLTHLACADLPDHPANAAQLAAIERLRRHFPRSAFSVGNTAGSQLAGDTGDDLSRVGIGLYGSNPSGRPAFRLAEAVQVHAAILQVRQVPAGTPVGYGATFVTRTDSTLLTIGIGYADGYLRSLSNTGWVLLGAQRLPVIGRVSMDYLVADATTVPPSALAAATEVTLLGGGIDADELATAAGTISYELLTRLGPRLNVQYLD